MDRLDCVILGAGVIGLAVARELALRGREVLVVDRGAVIGSETSSRNSEVIHAGIYYPAGSLKATTCVEGKQRLYRFCEERGVPHRRCGKLIVATDPGQVETLKSVQAKAAANGVDLEWLDQAAVTAREPEVASVAALWSPTTGIVDSHAFMLALQGEAEAHGAHVVLNTEFQSASVDEGGVTLTFTDGTQFSAASIINATGLFAPQIARAFGGAFDAVAPHAYYAKGNYYRLSGARPFSTLVYPVPEPGGLGVHATIDLGGQVRFGPDVEWLDGIDYSVDPARADGFYEAVRRYYPGLKDGALSADYAGIRPKIAGPGEAAADFQILGPRDHGVAHVVHMFGIESPGLTASLALAEVVALRLES